MTARRRIALRIAWVGFLVPPLVLIVYLSGSLLFTGGNIRPGGSPNWDEVWRSPFFPVPAALLTVPVAAGLAGLVVFLVGSRYTDVPALNFVLRFVLGSGPTCFFFPLLFSDYWADDAGIALTGYWIGLLLSGVALVVICVAQAFYIPRYNRAYRAGEFLPWKK